MLDTASVGNCIALSKIYIFFLNKRFQLFFPILGEIRGECFSLWTKWMREKLSIPSLRRSKYIYSFIMLKDWIFFFFCNCKIIFSQKILCYIYMYMYHDIFLALQLWPLFGGTMTKPEKGKLFYVPQVTVICTYNNLHIQWFALTCSCAVIHVCVEEINRSLTVWLVYFSDPIWR